MDISFATYPYDGYVILFCAAYNGCMLKVFIQSARPFGGGEECVREPPCECACVGVERDAGKEGTTYMTRIIIVIPIGMR